MFITKHAWLYGLPMNQSIMLPLKKNLFWVLSETKCMRIKRVILDKGSSMPVFHMTGVAIMGKACVHTGTESYGANWYIKIGLTCHSISECGKNSRHVSSHRKFSYQESHEFRVCVNFSPGQAGKWYSLSLWSVLRGPLPVKKRIMLIICIILPFLFFLLFSF